MSILGVPLSHVLAISKIELMLFPFAEKNVFFICLFC